MTCLYVSRLDYLTNIWEVLGGCSYQYVKIVWEKINLLQVFINLNTNILLGLSQIMLCIAGKPCGIDYEMKAYVGDTVEDKPHKRNSVRLAIRKVKGGRGSWELKY